MTDPGLDSRTPRAIARRSGESAARSVADTTTSKARFTARLEWIVVRSPAARRRRRRHDRSDGVDDAPLVGLRQVRRGGEADPGSVQPVRAGAAGAARPGEERLGVHRTP